MEQLGRAILKYKWFASAPVACTTQLGLLRQSHGVEVLVTDGMTLWLRGPAFDEETHAILRALLGCRLYRAIGDGQLVPHGKLVPLGHEPQGSWMPLPNWLTTALPASRLAMRSHDTTPLSLARSPKCETPGLVVVAREDWLAYAATAPQVRLDRLMFATSRKLTAVIGSPLPPIRGEYYWIENGIAAPVGFSWVPAVCTSVLRELFGLGEGDIALLSEGGRCSVLRHDQFVGATRSAVRLTEGVGYEEA